MDNVLLASDSCRVAVVIPCLVAINFVSIVAKLGSFPEAVASSLRVSSVTGAELTKLAIAVDNFAQVR